MRETGQKLFTGRRLFRLVIAAALLWTLGSYSYRFWRFHTGKPNLTLNLKQEVNAHLAGVPPESRAWTILSQLEGQRDPYPKDEAPNGADWLDYFPGDKHWPEVKRFVSSKQDILAAIREATSRPVMGCELHSDPDEDNPPALNLLLPVLGRSRACARILALDMRAAGGDADARRVIDDFDAMISLAQLCREDGILINDLVSIAIYALALNEIARIVPEHPGFLDDQQLEHLQHTVESYADGQVVRVRADRERQFVDDTIQRIFTDDGHGDGRVCAEGLRYMDLVGGGDGKLSFSQVVLTPLTLTALPTRRRCTDAVDRMFACIRIDTQTPRWERASLLVDEEYDRIDSSSEPGLLRALLLMTPAISKAIRACDQIEMQRAGALAGLALERYRLRNSRYPAETSELCPKFIDPWPVDGFTGGPLSFTVKNGQPVIYAFGCDMDDDGGVPPDKREDAMAGPATNAPSPNPKFNGDYVLWPVPRPAKRIPEELESPAPSPEPAAGPGPATDTAPPSGPQ